MPKKTPKAEDLPSTLQRSDEHAQEIFAATRESAEQTYDGDQARANRTAWAAVKHSYEKVGDHWEAKEEPGPSDEQAAGSYDTGLPTAGGVDANASKAHLQQVAKRLDVKGRSKMTKEELVAAIGRANNRETRRARKR